MPSYKGPSADQPTIDSEYSLKRNEAITKQYPDTAQFVARTMQQHHDYFVKKYLEVQEKGESLTEKEMEEYEIAMIRERQGLVSPLISF